MYTRSFSWRMDKNKKPLQQCEAKISTRNHFIRLRTILSVESLTEKKYIEIIVWRQGKKAQKYVDWKQKCYAHECITGETNEMRAMTFLLVPHISVAETNVKIEDTKIFCQQRIAIRMRFRLGSIEWRKLNGPCYNKLFLSLSFCFVSRFCFVCLSILASASFSLAFAFSIFLLLSRRQIEFNLFPPLLQTEQ